MSKLNAAQFGEQTSLPGMPAKKAGPYLGEYTPAPKQVQPYGGMSAAHDAERWGIDKSDEPYDPMEDNTDNWDESGRYGYALYAPNQIPAPTDAQGKSHDYAVDDINNEDVSTVGYHDGWMTPWTATSIQKNINPRAVGHMVEHANMLAMDDNPTVDPYDHEGVTHFSIEDGNHRVNAAQKQGRLVIPAKVYGVKP